MFWARALGAAVASSSLLSAKRSFMLCQPQQSEEKDEEGKEIRIPDEPNPSASAKILEKPDMRSEVVQMCVAVS